jgi:RecA/RadA recombinase
MSDEKEAGNFHYGGGKSEALGYALNKITDLCRTSPTTFVLLNQVRETPGVSFGPSKKPTGGLPARFVASVEIDLRYSPLGITRDGHKITGKWVHATIRKNKVRTPHYECDFLINFQGGLSKWGGVFELLENMKIVHVKRNKNKSLAENEFTITEGIRKGEVLPLSDFTKWVLEDKMLWRPIGEDAKVKENPQADEEETNGSSESAGDEGGAPAEDTK